MIKNNSKIKSIFSVAIICLALGAFFSSAVFLANELMPEKKASAIYSVKSGESAVNGDYVEAQMPMTGCSNYHTHTAASAPLNVAYCDLGEKFVVGGCLFDPFPNYAFPVTYSRPVMSGGRFGWSCLYRAKTSGVWSGPHADATAYVMCCE